MIRVLLADKLIPKVVDLLKEIPEFDIIEKTGMNYKELREEIKNYEAIVIRNVTKLNKKILENAKNLKLIVKEGIGLENLDVEFARSKNIEIRNTPYSASIKIAEYTLAFMLCICRSIVPSYKSIKEHKWDRKVFSEGIELFGKTAGIIGFEGAGKEVAKRELAFGMKVLFYDFDNIKTHINAKQVSFEELLKTSDFISVHIPLNDSTRDLISTSEFELMKSNIVLLNLAQTGVVDDRALLKALNENKIKAASIQVSEKDASEKFKLIDNEKVSPFPYLNDFDFEGQERVGLDVISILKDFYNV